MPSYDSSGARQKLSRTMRIDIAPGAIEETPPQKSPTVVKKATIANSASLANAGVDFHELFQSVYDAAVITDMSGKIVDANMRAVNFFLYNRDEIRSLNIISVISGSDESLLPTIRQHLTERFVLIESCFCARNDGSFFPAEIAVNQLRLAGNDYLCFFVRDITIRREAERQLRIEHNAIHNSRSGIAITNLTGIIEYANPAACNMWSCNDDNGLKGTDIRQLCKQDSGSNGAMNTIIEKGEGFVPELIAVASDGREFDIQVTAASNRDSDDELVGMVFSFVDISDHKRAEEATREAERQRVMLESVGAACHHLGQPATVLLANLGILQRKASTEKEDVRELISSCMTAAESVSEILHKLNAVNEYRTTRYLDSILPDGTESRILEI